jgi:hypothetical protein
MSAEIGRNGAFRLGRPEKSRLLAATTVKELFCDLKGNDNRFTAFFLSQLS